MSASLRRTSARQKILVVMGATFVASIATQSSSPTYAQTAASASAAGTQPSAAPVVPTCSRLGPTSSNKTVAMCWGRDDAVECTAEKAEEPATKYCRSQCRFWAKNKAERESCREVWRCEQAGTAAIAKQGNRIVSTVCGSVMSDSTVRKSLKEKCPECFITTYRLVASNPLASAETSMGEANTRRALEDAGIKVNKLPVSPNESFKDRPLDSRQGTDVGGVKREVIDGLLAFKRECDKAGPCNVVVSGGNETSPHKIASSGSHMSGDKIDVRADPTVRKFVDGNFVSVGGRWNGSRCEPQWTDPISCSCWALESDKQGNPSHFDIKFGRSCDPSSKCK